MGRRRYRRGGDELVGVVVTSMEVEASSSGGSDIDRGGDKLIWASARSIGWWRTRQGDGDDVRAPMRFGGEAEIGGNRESGERLSWGRERSLFGKREGFICKYYCSHLRSDLVLRFSHVIAS